DFGVDLGGPIVRDRLWFFGAYNRVDAPATVSRFFPSKFVSTSDQFPVDGYDNLYSGKLTWNAASGTSLVGTIFGDPTTITGASGSDPRQGVGLFQVRAIVNPDPTTWYSERRIGATDYGLRGSQIFGSWGLLTLQASRHQDRYELTAPNLVRTSDFRCEGGTPEEPCTPPVAARAATGG